MVMMFNMSRCYGDDVMMMCCCDDDVVTMTTGSIISNNKQTLEFNNITNNFDRSRRT